MSVQTHNQIRFAKVRPKSRPAAGYVDIFFDNATQGMVVLDEHGVESPLGSGGLSPEQAEGVLGAVIRTDAEGPPNYYPGDLQLEKLLVIVPDGITATGTAVLEIWAAFNPDPDNEGVYLDVPVVLGQTVLEVATTVRNILLAHTPFSDLWNISPLIPVADHYMMEFEQKEKVGQDPYFGIGLYGDLGIEETWTTTFVYGEEETGTKPAYIGQWCRVGDVWPFFWWRANTLVDWSPYLDVQDWRPGNYRAVQNTLFVIPGTDPNNWVNIFLRATFHPGMTMALSPTPNAPISITGDSRTQITINLATDGTGAYDATPNGPNSLTEINNAVETHFGASVWHYTVGNNSDIVDPSKIGPIAGVPSPSSNGNPGWKGRMATVRHQRYTGGAVYVSTHDHNPTPSGWASLFTVNLISQAEIMAAGGSLELESSGIYMIETNAANPTMRIRLGRDMVFVLFNQGNGVLEAYTSYGTYTLNPGCIAVFNTTMDMNQGKGYGMLSFPPLPGPGLTTVITP